MLSVPACIPCLDVVVPRPQDLRRLPRGLPHPPPCLWLCARENSRWDALVALPVVTASWTTPT